MKKLIICIMASILSLTFIPISLNAVTSDGNSSTEASNNAKTSDSLEVKAYMIRLDEIKAIDKSELNASEKKELRKEASHLNAEVRHSHHSGLFISTGAVILIVVLIIIL